jgi:hypothetical protein
MKKDTNTAPKLDGVKTEFEADAGGLVLKKSQEIPQSLLDSIKAKRDDSINHREGEFMHVASIPAVIAEKWMREGFNILDPNVNGKEIVRRLRAENLDAFLTTEKSL